MQDLLILHYLCGWFKNRVYTKVVTRHAQIRHIKNTVANIIEIHYAIRKAISALCRRNGEYLEINAGVFDHHQNVNIYDLYFSLLVIT